MDGPAAGNSREATFWEPRISTSGPAAGNSEGAVFWGPQSGYASASSATNRRHVDTMLYHSPAEASMLYGHGHSHESGDSADRRRVTRHTGTRTLMLTGLQRHSAFDVQVPQEMLSGADIYKSVAAKKGLPEGSFFLTFQAERIPDTEYPFHLPEDAGTIIFIERRPGTLGKVHAAHPATLRVHGTGGAGGAFTSFGAHDMPVEHRPTFFNHDDVEDDSRHAGTRTIFLKGLVPHSEFNVRIPSAEPSGADFYRSVSVKKDIPTESFFLMFQGQRIPNTDDAYNLPNDAGTIIFREKASVSGGRRTRRRRVWNTV